MNVLAMSYFALIKNI